MEELNRSLQLQIEELIVEMKVIQRRKDTEVLNKYEEKMEKSDDPELVPLLQERVYSLEKQLFESNKKYKNLQNILYNS